MFQSTVTKIRTCKRNMKVADIDINTWKCLADDLKFWSFMVQGGVWNIEVTWCSHMADRHSFMYVHPSFGQVKTNMDG